MTPPPECLWLPTLAELRRDKGAIGDVLRSVPEWVIRAADKWADQNSQRQWEREEPGRFMRNPWPFLVQSPAASEIEKAVFRAAESQILALRHVIGLGFGRATLKTDWYAEILKAEAKGDKRRAEYAKKKHAAAMIQYKEVQAYVREHFPDMVPQMECLLKTRRTKHPVSVRPWPKWPNLRRKFPLETMLVEWWVRFDQNGVPGLMFFRNAALAKLLLALSDKGAIPYCNFGCDYIKATRQRLGLIPMGDKKHLVWDVSVTRRSNGWEIAGSTRRRGKVFHGIVQLTPPPLPV